MKDPNVKSPDRAFQHRTNPNSTFDSICLRCFHTVVTTHSEFLLDSLESQHRCSEADLWRSQGMLAIDHRWRDNAE
jgi:hypothetical protein